MWVVYGCIRKTILKKTYAEMPNKNVLDFFHFD